MVDKGTKKKPDLQVIGTGSKAFRELFGEIKDARYSIYDGMTKLSNLARKNQFLDDIMTKNDELIAAGKRGFFYTDRVKAMRALPNNEIVNLDQYLAPMFKDGILVNRLKGMYTTKDIAEGIANAQNVSNFFRGERLGAIPAEKGVTWMYRNLILYPKQDHRLLKQFCHP